MYRRMCQSGWMAAQERRQMDARNGFAAQDRRSRLLLEIEGMLRHNSDPWMFPELAHRFEIHPTKRAVIATKITPLIQEFIDQGKLVATTEFFPKEGVYRLLLTIPQTPTRAVKQRGLDL